jgi:hypothetical protein
MRGEEVRVKCEPIRSPSSITILSRIPARRDGAGTTASAEPAGFPSEQRPIAVMRSTPSSGRPTPAEEQQRAANNADQGGAMSVEHLRFITRKQG